MIIGNNSFNNQNTNQLFNTRLTEVKKNNEKTQNAVNPFATDKRALANANITSKSDMLDKAFAMLQERLNNGTISLEDFNRKCNQLNKLRQK